MKPKAIVYTSNTGYTAEYAELLGEKTGLPVYALADAGEKPEKGSEIIYLGWLMAGRITGYKKAAKRFRIQAVCGVGLGANGSQLESVGKANKLPGDLPLFTLQGGFDWHKLHGIYKLMMTIMAKILGKKLAKKPNRTPEEDTMQVLLTRGGNCVCRENLRAVFAWYEKELPSQ